jgi:uncharacterized protein with von Willebrand factor type A (vWA) domain
MTHLVYTVQLTIDQLDDINSVLRAREIKREQEREQRRLKHDVKKPRDPRGHLVNRLEPQADGTAKVIRGLYQQPSPPKLQVIPDISTLKI